MDEPDDVPVLAVVPRQNNERVLVEKFRRRHINTHEECKRHDSYKGQGNVDVSAVPEEEPGDVTEETEGVDDVQGGLQVRGIDVQIPIAARTSYRRHAVQ